MQINNIICKVQIGQDRQDASEFQEVSEGDRSKTCYIVSEDGKRFAFQFTEPQPSLYPVRQLDCDIFVDGQLKRQAYVSGRSISMPRTIKEASQRISSGIKEYRKFRFGRVDTVESDDADVETSQSLIEGLGTLKVVFWEAEIIATKEKRPRPHITGLERQSSQEKPLHEKSLKGRAIPHRTVFGAPRIRAKRIHRTKRLGPPIATFTFKYSSRECLVAQGIIPSSQEPEDDDVMILGREDFSARNGPGNGGPSRNHPDLDGMSVDQLRDELRRRRELEDMTGEDLRHKIKREIKQENFKQERRSSGPAGTIDLTGDD